MTPFGTWLAEIGLGNYEDVFAANKIDFDVIHQMTDADLRELGLALGGVTTRSVRSCTNRRTN